MELRDLVEATMALREIADTDGIPMKTTFKLGRILRLFQVETNAVGRAEKELERKFAKMDDGGNVQTNPHGIPLYTDRAAYLKELEELMDSELTLEFEALKISEFGKKFTIKARQAGILEAVGILELDG